MDQLQQDLHVSAQMASRSIRDLDNRFEQLSTALKFRSQPPPPGTFTRGQPTVETREILRTIAQTDLNRMADGGEAARNEQRAAGSGSVAVAEKITPLPVTPRTPRRAGTPSTRDRAT